MCVWNLAGLGSWLRSVVDFVRHLARLLGLHVGYFPGRSSSPSERRRTERKRLRARRAVRAFAEPNLGRLILVTQYLVYRNLWQLSTSL